MKRVALVSLMAAIACSHDFDALYEGPGAGAGSEADAGSGGVAAPEALPRAPARPDADRMDDCARCAEGECDREHADCGEDDGCIAELRCKATCNNPACLQKCNAQHGWSPWYADYANCVFRQCPGECNVGNNWECVEEYDWPAAHSQASTFNVLFRFETHPLFFFGQNIASSPVGATVRACLDEPQCAEIDSAEIGIDGSVELEIDADGLRPQDFRGYLEIDEGRWRYYPSPLARAQEYYTSPVNAGFGPPGTDFERARVQAIVVDCLAAPVQGARVTLPDLPEITAFALINRLTWSSGPTKATGIAQLIDLPDSAADSRLRVRAVHDDTGELIAERAIWVRPGFQTLLLLGPAAISD